MDLAKIGAERAVKPEIPLERVSDQVRQLIAVELGLLIADVSREAVLRVDFGVDSFDLVELALRLEAAFDIEIPDDALTGARTVADLEDFIRERMRSRGLTTPGRSRAGVGPAPAHPMPARYTPTGR